MNAKQNRIFGKLDEALQKEPAPSRKKLAARFFSCIKKIYSLLKGVAGLVGVLWFLWGTLGEYFLPHDGKFSTFMGGRTGTIESERNRKAALSEANRYEVMTAAQGAPQIMQQCETNRVIAGQQAFAGCMDRPGSLLTGCEFQRDAVLAQKCEKFTPEQLSPTYTSTKQTGELP